MKKGLLARLLIVSAFIAILDAQRGPIVGALGGFLVAASAAIGFSAFFVIEDDFRIVRRHRDRKSN